MIAANLPPSSFSYEARALEEAFWEAGAKAEALARREATRASFIVTFDCFFPNPDNVRTQSTRILKQAIS